MCSPLLCVALMPLVLLRRHQRLSGLQDALE
jgi:hypothetical protein